MHVGAADADHRPAIYGIPLAVGGALDVAPEHTLQPSPAAQDVPETRPSLDDGSVPVVSTALSMRKEKEEEPKAERSERHRSAHAALSRTTGILHMKSTDFADSEAVAQPKPAHRGRFLTSMARKSMHLVLAPAWSSSAMGLRWISAFLRLFIAFVRWLQSKGLVGEIGMTGARIQVSDAAGGPATPGGGSDAWGECGSPAGPTPAPNARGPPAPPKPIGHFNLSVRDAYLSLPGMFWFQVYKIGPHWLKSSTMRRVFKESKT